MSSVDGTTAPRTFNRTRWIVAGVGAVLTILVLVLATRPAADSSGTATPLVGRPAPPLAGATLDGRNVDVASFRGRYVIVNFFATWCVPCRAEHPELKAFTERHAGAKDPAVIGVAYDHNDIGAARSFFAQQGGTWPVVAENGDRIAVDYGVRGLPESYVIDPGGNISAHVTGPVTADALDGLTAR